MTTKLPSSAAAFAEDTYWKEFYSSRGQFEWYGTWEHLAHSVEPFLRVSDKILELGCGNSNFAQQLYDNGYRNLTAIDQNQEVIMAQKRMHATEKRPQLHYECMDATKTTYASESFGCIVDKGTLDALCPPPKAINNVLDDNQGMTLSVPLVDALFDEVDRLLAPLGRWVCVSLAQEHILQYWMQSLTNKGQYMLRVQMATWGDWRDDPTGRPVFLLIATKLRAPAKEGDVPVQQFVPKEPKGERAAKPRRIFTIEQMLHSVRFAQNVCQLTHRAHFSKFSHIPEVRFYDQTNGLPRFVVNIIDAPDRPKLNSYAVMIAPFGREHEWLFSTEQGQRVLQSQCLSHRLLLVRTCTGQSYGPYDQLQLELNAFVMDFAPMTYKQTNAAADRVPYLLVTDSLGEREQLGRSQSAINGTIIVDQVKVGDDMYRRLVFAGNTDLVQSEVRLKPVTLTDQLQPATDNAHNKKKKGKKGRGKQPMSSEHKRNGESDWVLDECELACAHHQLMSAAFVLLMQGDTISDVQGACALLGLGAGLLAMRLRTLMPALQVNAVELDPEVVSLGREHFGLVTDEHLIVHEGDAVEYVAASQPNVCNMLLCDVAGNATDAQGLSAPIEAMLHPTFIQNVHSMLMPDGCAVVNVVCRRQDKINEIQQLYRQVFDTVFVVSVPEEVNSLLMCLPYGLSQTEWHAKLTQHKTLLIDTLLLSEQLFEALTQAQFVQIL